MDLTNETFAPLRVMVDEFVRAGIEHAVVAPGSRNAPIAYALGDRSELKTWSVLDERQAGFFALGIAKSTGKPVIVTCTSGSAAANLHPAVIEASHAGIPLIVLSADRPPELRDVGAGQAIDQIKLYGDSVRWFLEAGNHPICDETLRHFRASASRAVAEASSVDPGPVHINLPLREPLTPVSTELGDVEDSLGARGRADRAPWSAHRTSPAAAPDLAAALLAAERPLIVAGEQTQRGLAEAIAQLAGKAGAPVLVDSLSQLRRRGLGDSAQLVAAYDLILRSERVRQELQPDLIVRIGETPTSKPLRAWLAGAEARQIMLDPRGRWQDPSRTADELWQCDPLLACEAATASLHTPVAKEGWTSAWGTLENAAQAEVELALKAEPFPFEPAAYRDVLGRLEAASVFVSSSMPIRDVEAYSPIGSDTVRYLANRGTNGIDGVVSSALGVRAPYDCDRVVLLTGDLAFLYDASALQIAAAHALPLTILCVDNDGGGIFSFLPLAEHRDHFERLIATPPSVDVEAIVKAYRFAYCAPENPEQLLEAIERPGFVHLRTTRTENKAAHDRVAARVVRSVEQALD